jgi:hypothetical protein
MIHAGLDFGEVEGRSRTCSGWLLVSSKSTLSQGRRNSGNCERPTQKVAMAEPGRDDLTHCGVIGWIVSDIPGVLELARAQADCVLVHLFSS